MSNVTIACLFIILGQAVLIAVILYKFYFAPRDAQTDLLIEIEDAEPMPNAVKKSLAPVN